MVAEEGGDQATELEREAMNGPGIGGGAALEVGGEVVTERRFHWWGGFEEEVVRVLVLFMALWSGGVVLVFDGIEELK